MMGTPAYHHLCQTQTTTVYAEGLLPGEPAWNFAELIMQHCWHDLPLPYDHPKASLPCRLPLTSPPEVISAKNTKTATTPFISLTLPPATRSSPAERPDATHRCPAQAKRPAPPTAAMLMTSRRPHNRPPFIIPRKPNPTTDLLPRQTAAGNPQHLSFHHPHKQNPPPTTHPQADTSSKSHTAPACIPCTGSHSSPRGIPGMSRSNNKKFHSNPPLPTPAGNPTCHLLAR